MTSQEILQNEIQLENHRALLKPLTTEHADALEDVAYHPALWELGMNSVASRNDLNRYIATALKERAAGTSYPFLITDKETGVAAGSTRFGNISHENKRVEIGWTWIGKQYQGTGLNKACKFELLKFAFETLKFNRVELKTDMLNKQSQRAMEKIGATREGVFRSHQITSRGRIRDSVFYSIIASEWPEVKSRIFPEFL